MLLAVTGCRQQPAQIQKPVKFCPGAANALEAMQRLKPQTTSDLLAKGTAEATFYSEGRKRNESFPVKMWASPQDKLRFHGDVLFNPRGIDMGANAELFWVAMKPNELGNIYQWDMWSDADYLEEMLLNPKAFLQALNLTSPADSFGYSFALQTSEIYDILLKKTLTGQIKEKIFIDKCNYEISKIHYYNARGKLFAIVTLDNYKSVVGDFSIPADIYFQKLPLQTVEEWAEIRLQLNKIEPKNFTPRQQEIYFSRPPTRGYDDVYKLSEVRF